MEKILESLRNYKAHSFPFLKPVQKKEAPNYYDSTFFLLILSYYSSDGSLYRTASINARFYEN